MFVAPDMFEVKELHSYEAKYLGSTAPGQSEDSFAKPLRAAT